MSEGIQETKEALAALNVLSISLVKLFKKHATTSEMVVALLGDEELKNALLKAYEGISKVPAELKDVNLAEGVELALLQVQVLPALVAALKG